MLLPWNIWINNLNVETPLLKINLTHIIKRQFTCRWVTLKAMSKIDHYQTTRQSKNNVQLFAYCKWIDIVFT